MRHQFNPVSIFHASLKSTHDGTYKPRSLSGTPVRSATYARNNKLSITLEILSRRDLQNRNHQQDFPPNATQPASQGVFPCNTAAVTNPLNPPSEFPGERERERKGEIASKRPQSARSVLQPAGFECENAETLLTVAELSVCDVNMNMNGS